MHAHLVMGHEVVIGGVHTKFSDSEYNDETGLAFIMDSLEKLRKEILARRAALGMPDPIRRLVDWEI
jgi:chromate reductase